MTIEADAIGDEAGGPAAPGRFSAAWRRGALSLLLAAYTFNFIDRTIINTIGQAIKVDLKITDTQLGLLGGFAFAVLYSFLGVPIARLAERFNRVWIIGAAVALWSGFTAACGAAATFGQLLAMRIGVGIGEAGCSPPSHALISDFYAPDRRASALSVYAFGIPLGGLLGAVAGGWLAQHFNWRVAFMVVGLPGAILALIMMLVIEEPREPRPSLARRVLPALLIVAGSLAAAAGVRLVLQVVDLKLFLLALAALVAAPIVASAAARAGLRRELGEMASVARALFGRPAVLHITLGMTIVSFSGYGGGAFSGPYFVRAFGLGYATVGLVFGMVGGVSAGLGTLLGGFLSDWAGRFSTRWYALIPAIGLTAAVPIYLSAYMQADWRAAALILVVPGALSYTYLAPSFGLVQNAVAPRQRATAAAVFLLFVNIIALGGGPLFTGALIDALAQHHFAAAGLADHAAAFAKACPGGRAPDGAGPALAGACHGALVKATRQGMMVTVAIALWGAFHYFLAGRALAREPQAG